MATHLSTHFCFPTKLGWDAVCLGHTSTKNMNDIYDSYTELNASECISFFECFEHFERVPSVDVVDGGCTSTYVLLNDYNDFLNRNDGEEETLNAEETLQMFDENNNLSISSTNIPTSMVLHAPEPLEIKDVAPMVDLTDDLYNLTRSASIDELTPLREMGCKRSSFSTTMTDSEIKRQKKDKGLDDTTNYLPDIIEAHVNSDASHDTGSFTNTVSTIVKQLRNCEITETYMEIGKFLKRFKEYVHLQSFWDFMQDSYIKECTNQIINKKVVRAIVWKS